jgi:hypothetical protein
MTDPTASEIILAVQWLFAPAYGKYVYPLSGAVPQLKLVYVSRVALAIYAWIGPIAETTVLWMFLLLVLNAKTYLQPQSGKGHTRRIVFDVGGDVNPRILAVVRAFQNPIARASASPSPRSAVPGQLYVNEFA